MTTPTFTATIENNLLIIKSNIESPQTILEMSMYRHPAFFIRGNEVVVSSGDDERRSILKTDDENTLNTLMNIILQEIENNNVQNMLDRTSHDKTTSGQRSLLKRYLDGPVLLAFLLGMGVTLLAGGHLNKRASTSVVPAVIQSQDTLGSSNAVKAPVKITPNRPEMDQAVLGNNLKKAAARELFTIPYSSGHKRTLYVFSDPQCPNCVNFDPLFNAMSSQYNIEVFPTSIVGGDKSATDIVPVLCLPQDKRKDSWDKLFAIDEGLSPVKKVTPEPELQSAPSDCSIAQKALDVNNKAFRQYRFPGTPWVIADDGRHVPQAVMKSPEAMREFMAITKGEINAAQ